jgi:hypothetical protein
VRNGSTATGLNGKAFVPWWKTSGITFLIVSNKPITSELSFITLADMYGLKELVVTPA